MFKASPFDDPGGAPLQDKPLGGIFSPSRQQRFSFCCCLPLCNPLVSEVEILFITSPSQSIPSMQSTWCSVEQMILGCKIIPNNSFVGRKAAGQQRPSREGFPPGGFR